MRLFIWTMLAVNFGEVGLRIYMILTHERGKKRIEEVGPEADTFALCVALAITLWGAILLGQR